VEQRQQKRGQKVADPKALLAERWKVQLTQEMDCAAEFALLAQVPVQARLAKMELVALQLATVPAAEASEIFAAAEREVLSAQAE
jgi:hypothetical protein